MRLNLVCAVVLAVSLQLIALLSYADNTYPDNLYWGDTHVHTNQSVDAYTFNTRLTPDDAYRFAQGKPVRTPDNQLLRRSRPLDFVVVSDHAENIGFLPALESADPTLLATDTGLQWYKKFGDFLIAIRQKDEATKSKWYEYFQDILPESMPLDQKKTDFPSIFAQK